VRFQREGPEVNRVCSRCGETLDSAVGEACRDFVVSRGLCHECSRHLLALRGMPLLDYLDGLRAPVAVVDSDGVLRAANRQLCELVGKDLSSVRGNRGGDVFECAYAGLPGGCGRTSHCSGCTIRRAVTETLTTGVSRDRVPASLQEGSPGRARPIELLISTERVGNHVLLRIDMMGGRRLLEDRA
jgi:PAS domain-containing protein